MKLPSVRNRKKNNMEKMLTFDDVVIAPGWSPLDSRKEAKTETVLGKRIKLRVPIVSANMETITGVEMARAVSQFGGLAILHRFWDIADNVKAFYAAVKDNGYKDNVGVSIGISERERERAMELYNAGAWIFCIDVANAAQMNAVKQCIWLKENYPGVCVIVGNFATSETIAKFDELCGEYKPNCYKVGIGPGAVCTTRVKTGLGVPQLSAVMDCAKKFEIISDGGHRSPGDINKSLAAGARAVMIGGMLAGTEEAAGTKYKTSFSDRLRGKPTCTYRGSAYREAPGDYYTSEGEVTEVDYKGEVINVLKDIEGGLRSGMLGAGARDLEEFKKAKFIQVSLAGYIEGTPHGKR